MARMDRDWNLEKLGQVFILCLQKSPKKYMVSALWWNLFDFSYITLQELFVYALINDFNTATSLWPSPLNSHLNSSTIDELAEGAWKDGGAQEPVAYGNHDNPVSGNHQAPSHWYLPHTYHREGGRAGSQFVEHKRKQAQHTWDWVDLNSIAVKPRDPL